MRLGLLRLVAVGLVATTLVACGSQSESDGRDRNVDAGFGCAQGGACALGDIGPGGGIVFVAADKGGTAWEAAPLNGYGTFEDATVLVKQLDFGGKTDWVLPSPQRVADLWTQRDLFLCPQDSDCPNVFADGTYWSDSRSEDAVSVWSFSVGGQTRSKVETQNYVRPVRAIVIGSPSTTVPATAPATVPTTAAAGQCRLSYVGGVLTACKDFVTTKVVVYGSKESLSDEIISMRNARSSETVSLAKYPGAAKLRVTIQFSDGSSVSDVFIPVGGSINVTAKPGQFES